MSRLKREIAGINDQQWTVLISLLTLVNLVVLGGLIWLLTLQSSGRFLIVFAQAPVTRTPYPTFTPASSISLFSTPLNTRVPTWTPTVTPTPTDTPTVTPIPTKTAIRATRVPLATATPTPAYDYLGTIRQLTPCENAGKHHIFVYIHDQAGNSLPGIRTKVSWPGGEAILISGTKIEDPGLADFAMFKGAYFIEVLDASSELLGPISPDIPYNELCEETGNGVANSFYHYSFEVIFTKAR